jgi:hypothetical protein
MDAQIRSTLDGYIHGLPEATEEIGRPPPRSVAVALALAVLGQPHVGITIAPGRPQGTDTVHGPPPRPLERPLATTPEALAAGLGLPRWEVDDLREGVDVRAARRLKAQRMVVWLWNRFGFPSEGRPEALFRLLFPGLDRDVGRVGFVRCGAAMYAVIDTDDASSTLSVHMPWTAREGDSDHAPLSSFQARYVDPDLRRAIGRAVGADDVEVCALLDRSIALVPRRALESWLRADTWRTSGAATLTDLAATYPAGSWLVEPLGPHDVAWDSWLGARADRDGLTWRDELPAFDQLATPRVSEMMRLTYAAMLSDLAGQLPDGRVTTPQVTLEDLDFLDAGTQIRAVLAPLLAWPRNAETVRTIAAMTEVDPDAARASLEQLATRWADHLGAGWTGTGTAPTSVHATVLGHLIRTRTTLYRLYHRPPDPRGDHRTIVLLFAAHYLGSTPLERLWADAASTDTWPPARPAAGDALTEWFWGAWQRLLDALDEDAAPAGSVDATWRA